MPAYHQLDREKFKEAILLIASHCPPQELGNVKLHKALYFADMLFYNDEGRPLTGVEYIKQKFGPVARHLTAVVNDLIADGRLRVDETDYYGLKKKTYVVLEKFSPTRLSEQEQNLLRDAADFVRGKSAKEISEFSHNAAWEAAELGEIIPYFTALRLIPVEVYDSDRQWALETAREIAAEPPPL
jgi:uncharacterized phage-associated protein